MRIGSALVFGVAALAAVSCGGASSSPTAPGRAASMSGTWTGTAADSTGSMMGAGLTGAMMAGTTWTITQSDGSFTGTMSFAGYKGGGMTVTGTVVGHTGSFTINMPARHMMTADCAATATGTFDMDDMMTVLHATYAGANTCTGPFTNGTLTMHR